jgi:transcriptional regulator GlxA family with amidase domain
MSRARTRRVAVVAFPRVQILDVTGPLEVFARTARLLRDRGRSDDAYSVAILASKRGPLVASSGLTIVADRAFARAGALDTLLVAGGIGTADAARDRSLVAWLRRTRPRVRRFGSVCTGAFVLAAAGLLDGKRATTHWQQCAALAERFAAIDVEPDAIFVKDGATYTSAGVTAGMDLALAMVEEDHGREVALDVARQLVLFLRRPGGQSQFSAQLAAQVAEREPLRDLQAYIVEHVGADLSIDACARRVGMSARNFGRVFAREVGKTPAAFVEAARIDAARRMLEDTGDGIDGIAIAAGFGSSETMRRAFVRAMGTTPGDYRRRFRVH